MGVDAEYVLVAACRKTGIRDEGRCVGHSRVTAEFVELHVPQVQDDRNAPGAECLRQRHASVALHDRHIGRGGVAERRDGVPRGPGAVDRISGVAVHHHRTAPEL